MICKIINVPAYIDYGNEPPPAATTSFHPNGRIAKSRKGKIETLGNRVCMPETCANKGVCYEPYDEGILKAAPVRQEYISEKGKNSQRRISSPVCDCDLTTYTGPTCEEGNAIFLLRFPVANIYMWKYVSYSSQSVANTQITYCFYNKIFLKYHHQ